MATPIITIDNLTIRDYQPENVPKRLQSSKVAYPRCAYCQADGKKVATGDLSLDIPFNEIVCEKHAAELTEAFSGKKPIPRRVAIQKTISQQEDSMKKSNGTPALPFDKPSKKSAAAKTMTPKEAKAAAKAAVAKAPAKTETKKEEKAPAFTIDGYFRPLLEKGGITIEALQKKAHTDLKGHTSRDGADVALLAIRKGKKEWGIKVDDEAGKIIGKK
jgi:hypothetical protein